MNVKAILRPVMEWSGVISYYQLYKVPRIGKSSQRSLLIGFIVRFRSTPLHLKPPTPDSEEPPVVMVLLPLFSVSEGRKTDGRHRGGKLYGPLGERVVRQEGGIGKADAVRLKSPGGDTPHRCYEKGLRHRRTAGPAGRAGSRDRRKIGCRMGGPG